MGFRKLPSDMELLERVKARDAQALSELYERFERPMYAFAYRMMKDRMLAEEVVQELFLRVWNHAVRFEDRQGKVSTWMFAIARNIAIDFLRSRSRRPSGDWTEPDALEQVSDGRPATEEQVEARLVGEQVREALSSLNVDQKQVIEWIYYEGYTQQEVSSRHAIPLGTVKSRVRLAFRTLKEKLAEFGTRGGYEHE